VATNIIGMGSGMRTEDVSFGGENIRRRAIF
jgi:hypothetical protein